MNINIAKTLLSYRNSLYMDKYNESPSYSTRSDRLQIIPAYQSTIFAIVMDIASYGYALGNDIIHEMSNMDGATLIQFHTDTTNLLKEVLGDNYNYVPLFRNFPESTPVRSHALHYATLEFGDYALFIDLAIYYSWSPEEYNGTWFGRQFPGITLSEVMNRPELVCTKPLKVLGKAGNCDIIEIFDNILSSKISMSDSDKKFVTAVIQKDYLLGSDGIPRPNSMDCKNYYIMLNHCPHDRAYDYSFPEDIPNKENLAFLIVEVSRQGNSGLGCGKGDMFSPYVKTATDVLRIAAALSGSDVSLKEHTRFKISNSGRKFIMSTLNSLDYNSATEDMLRYHGLWLILAKYLHANAYSENYPNAVKMIQSIRNAPRSIPTFNKAVEAELSSSNMDMVKLVKMLKTRPGDFARRLDHVLRVSNDNPIVVDAFLSVADKVATPLLLNLITHMYYRDTPANVRVFLPKGSTTNAIIQKTDSRKSLSSDTCNTLSNRISQILSDRFSEKESLGNVYIDRNLHNIIVPTSVRNSSPSLRTFARGSQFPIDMDAEVVRMFLYWEDGDHHRVDIDLSLQLMDKDYKNLGVVSYYNLRDVGITHSGDFTSAPNGAAEFIDININEVLKGTKGARYVAMTVNSFTGQTFNTMVAKAGYMVRDGVTGKGFEPKTVEQKYDVTASTKFSVPMVFDLIARKMIWLDVGFVDYNHSCTNIGDKGLDLGVLTQYAIEMYREKSSMLDLIMLHTEMRAKSVTFDFDPEVEYDTVLDMNFASQVDTIMANWL